MSKKPAKFMPCTKQIEETGEIQFTHFRNHMRWGNTDQANMWLRAAAKNKNPIATRIVIKMDMNSFDLNPEIYTAGCDEITEDDDVVVQWQIRQPHPKKILPSPHQHLLDRAMLLMGYKKAPSGLAHQTDYALAVDCLVALILHTKPQRAYECDLRPDAVKVLKSALKKVDQTDVEYMSGKLHAVYKDRSSHPMKHFEKAQRLSLQISSPPTP